MREPLLFVYGTLRPGFDGPMAYWLSQVARHVGGAVARGRLYRVDGYPGFVPGGGGEVAGDLFALPDAGRLLAALDEHEECAGHHPRPHEYHRQILAVRREQGPVKAWTYVYVRDVAGLPLIESGDFLR